MYCTSYFSIIKDKPESNIILGASNVQLPYKPKLCKTVRTYSYCLVLVDLTGKWPD